MLKTTHNFKRDVPFVQQYQIQISRYVHQELEFFARDPSQGEWFHFSILQTCSQEKVIANLQNFHQSNPTYSYLDLHPYCSQVTKYHEKEGTSLLNHRGQRLLCVHRRDERKFNIILLLKCQFEDKFVNRCYPPCWAFLHQELLFCPLQMEISYLAVQALSEFGDQGHWFQSVVQNSECRVNHKDQGCSSFPSKNKKQKKN